MAFNKKVILDLDKILETQVESIEKLCSLFERKREILIEGNADKLLQIDSEIISKMQEAKEISENCNCVLSAIEFENLSQLNEKLQAFDENLSKRIEEKQSQLKNLQDRMSSLHKVNKQLIDTGLKLVSENLQIILKSAGKSTCEYDESGSRIENQIELSSIIEEG